jgi:hypothetical protein
MSKDCKADEIQKIPSMSKDCKANEIQKIPSMLLTLKVSSEFRQLYNLLTL